MRRDVPRRVFRGREFAMVSAQARASLGADAVILRTNTVRVNGIAMIEVIAAAATDVERFEARLTPVQPPAPAGRPYVIALIGPTGAGKTTTAVKMALHPEALGMRKVGFITLDTYRAGAVAQLETYAQVAGLPFEVVYEPGDVAAALARLADRDIVVVDTPGRGPKNNDDSWRALLAELKPDEVHLVMPATVRPDIAEVMRDGLAGEATHLVLTKLDEVPDEEGVADLAARLDLPVRWVADGQAIPTDLAPGVPRLLHGLGVMHAALPAPNAEPWR